MVHWNSCLLSKCLPSCFSRVHQSGVASVRIKCGGAEGFGLLAYFLTPGALLKERSIREETRYQFV